MQHCDNVVEVNDRYRATRLAEALGEHLCHGILAGSNWSGDDDELRHDGPGAVMTGPNVLDLF